VPPGLDLTTTVYACWRAGAAIVVADAGLGWRQMADALRSADPDYLIGIPPAVVAAAVLKLPGIRFVAGELPRSMRRLLRVEHSLDELAAGGDPSPAPSSDEAAVLFTSGATGPPKGVVYQHHQLLAQLELLRGLCNITRVIDWWQHSPRSRCTARLRYWRRRSADGCHQTWHS
jgi:acyl-coenzyme A synthetase/AMP-(fatty) acid ligase